MFALAVDGNVLAVVESKAEVVEKLRDKAIRDNAYFNADGRIEVASFRPGEGWIPICVDKFAQADYKPRAN
jgi:hypothetical protein